MVEALLERGDDALLEDKVKAGFDDLDEGLKGRGYDSDEPTRAELDVLEPLADQVEAEARSIAVEDQSTGEHRVPVSVG